MELNVFVVIAWTIWTFPKFLLNASKNRFVFNLSFWTIPQELSKIFFPTVFVSLYALVMILNEYKTFLNLLSLIVFRFQSVLIKAFSPST